MMVAADVTTAIVISVLPDNPVQELAKLFQERQISGVHLTDESGQMVGIVSRSTLLQALVAADI